jgi:hypothetical protein
MKLSGIALSLALGAATLLGSCVPNPVNNEEPNSLVSTPRTLHIVNAGDTVTSMVKLTCGCPFEIDSLFFLGDTNAIKYTLPEAITTHLTPHEVRFYVPVGTAPGNYSAQLAIYVLDDNNQKFYDTISVAMP